MSDYEYPTLLSNNNSDLITDANYSTTMVTYGSTTMRSSIPHKNSTDTENPFPTMMLGFTSVCAFLIAILGTIGNIITIVALVKSKKLRTPSTAYVINLAVVELLFCLIILPISGAQYEYLRIYADSWLTDSECIHFAVLRYTLTQTELQTIVAIAFTRATAVGCPRFYQRINTKQATTIYIACIWIYSFILKLPTGLGVFGSYKFNPKTMECDLSNDGHLSALSRFVAIILEVLFPVLAIFGLYVYIFVMVRKSSLRVRKTASVIAASRTSDVQSSEVEPTEKGSKSSFKILKRKFSDNNLRQRFARRSSSVTTASATSRRDIRLARTIFIIFLLLLICSVPVGVTHSVDRDVNNKVWFLLVHILYWIQYCLNMVIYAIMNRQYRDAYVDFFAMIMPSCQKHKGFSFPWESPSVAPKQVHGTNNLSVKRGSDKKTEETSLEEDKHDSLLQNRLPAIQEVTSSSYAEIEPTESVHDSVSSYKPVKRIDDDYDDIEDIDKEEQEVFLNDEIST